MPVYQTRKLLPGNKATPAPRRDEADKKPDPGALQGPGAGIAATYTHLAAGGLFPFHLRGRDR